MTPAASQARDLRRRDRAALVAELDAVGVRWLPDGKTCSCFAHDDTTPSAGIFARDGVWKFHCFPCGLTLDVFDLEARRMARPLADVVGDFARANDPKPEPPRRPAVPSSPDGEPGRSYRRYDSPEAVYAAEEGAYRLHKYTHPDTGVVELVKVGVRDPSGKKRFVQASPARDGGGGFWKKKPDGPQPLYNRRRLRDASTAVVVEGENKVEALTPLLPVGWAATCCPGGSSGAGEADWSPLAGRRLILWPDNDAPDPKGRRVGVEHMREVLALAGRLDPPCEAFWIDPDALGLPPKGDAVDFLALRRAAGCDTPGKLRQSLDLVWDQAAPCGGAAPLWRLYEDTFAGRRESVPWPWPVVSRLTHALLPGTITLVGGPKAAGKTFLVLEALWHWLGLGHRVAALELEDGLDYHLNRVHAQAEGDGRLFDPTWVKDHPAEVRESFRRRKAELDRMARVLDAHDEDEVQTTANVLEWMRRRLAEGCRVLVVDPVTAVQSERPWVEDLELLMPAKSLLKRYGASLVLVTHPDRSGKNLARSEAYPRFTHTIVNVRRHDKPEELTVALPLGATRRGRFNRTVQIEKARNGPGTGSVVAYQWDGASLRFAECGLVVDDKGVPE